MHECYEVREVARAELGLLQEVVIGSKDSGGMRWREDGVPGVHGHGGIPGLADGHAASLPKR
eukprot:2993037-Alexandrium_andersonii.AAC.1